MRSAQGARFGRAAARRDRRRPVTSPMAPITAVNQTWTTDFKGHFRTGDGVYCYPLDVARWLQSLRAALRRDWPGPTYAAAGRASNARSPSMGCPSAYGVITAARLRAPASRRLSRLSIWWMRLGIIPERIAAWPSRTKWVARAVPCGAEGRHRATAGDACARSTTRLIASVRNTTTSGPDEALQDAVPASCYQPCRAAPRQLPAARVSWASWRSVASRLSDRSSWRAPVVYQRSAGRRHDIAFEEVDDGFGTIRFASMVSRLAMTNVNAAFNRSHRCTARRSSAALVARLTGRKNNDQKPQ